MTIKDFFKRYKNNSKKGFTIIEVLAVVCILAIASTATISVFLAVQTTVRDTGEITTDQHSTTQVERFIRNEIQVGSNIDCYYLDTSAYVPDSAVSGELEQNYECIMYDPTTKSVIIKKITEDKSTYTTSDFKQLLSIQNVEKMTIHIYPINQGSATNVDDYEGKKLKLVYTIEATDYTYSGGMVIGNSSIDGTSGDMKYYASDPSVFGVSDIYSAELTWSADTSVANDNDVCVCFKSEVPYEPPTTSHP